MIAQSTKLRKIIVASDLSDQAGLAIDRAIELGFEHDAEVVIVHIVDEGLPADVQSYLMTASDHDIRKKLEDHPLARQVTATIDIVAGRPDLDITERADIEECDLIVLGLHNRILEENLAIEGSIVERIVANTHLPVLIVKNTPSGAYKSVVVGIDFSVHALEAATWASTIAPTASIQLIHAYQNPLDLTSRLNRTGASSRSLERRQALMTEVVAREMSELEERALSGFSVRPKVQRISIEGLPHEVLSSEATRLQAELIAIGTHGRLGLARTVVGSVATEILNKRVADVLVVRPY
ncbi:MAG: universal stress protein [Hyphomicrobiaceae bacterium]